MRTWIIVIFIALATGGGYYFWQMRAAKPVDKAAEGTKTAVARGAIMRSVASTGRVVSNLDVDIKCRASGQVTKLPFDVSQHVKQGDLLIQLDPSDQQRSVDLASATVAQTTARFAQSKQNLLVAEQSLETARQRAEAALESTRVRAADLREKAEWRKSLLDAGQGSYEEYSTTQSDAAQAESDYRNAEVQMAEVKTQELALEVRREDIKLAEAQLQSDQISLANARQQLDYTTVNSPLDGVVAALNIQIGTIISSGITNVGGGTTIMTISDLSRIFVLAAVDESDIGSVAIDQPAVITADAFPGRRFDGKVVRIATRGVNVSNVVTFEVKIEITAEDKKLLKPEMTTNIQIIVAQRDDVVVVPAAAIHRKEGQTFVTVVNAAGVNEERKVKTGLTDGERTEILDGLTEAETLFVRKDDPASRWRGDQARPNSPNPLMMPGMGPPRGGGGGGGRR